MTRVLMESVATVIARVTRGGRHTSCRRRSPLVLTRITLSMMRPWSCVATMRVDRGSSCLSERGFVRIAATQSMRPVIQMFSSSSPPLPIFQFQLVHGAIEFRLLDVVRFLRAAGSGKGGKGTVPAELLGRPRCMLQRTIVGLPVRLGLR